MNIIIPAAGAGSRFKQAFNIPKPYINVDNLPMVATAAKTLKIPDATYYYILPAHEKLETTKNYLQSITPDCHFFDIDYVTEGAVQTALIAKDFINNDDELIITNCDQIMNWDPMPIIESFKQFDAGLVTINSDDAKHSYLELTDNKVTKVVEKQVISDQALTGVHYWKHGKFFVEAADEMINTNDKILNEYYVSNSYNYLIKHGRSVGYHQITSNEITFIGTVQDLYTYFDSSPWQSR